LTIGRRIEICGGIASGKTTLAELLREHGIAAVLERFDENPFWPLFCAEPRRYAFEAEVTFLLQHYSQMRDAHDLHEIFAYDSSLVQDMAYAQVNLGTEMLEVFEVVHGYARRSLPTPIMIVHLVCEAAVELGRILGRGRPQEAAITTEYLTSLNRQVQQNVDEARSGVRVVVIDSAAENFATDNATRARIGSRIVNELRRATAEVGDPIRDD
jgi:deoxyadenosine/deoxycytidine kinase